MVRFQDLCLHTSSVYDLVRRRRALKSIESIVLRICASFLPTVCHRLSLLQSVLLAAGLPYRSALSVPRMWPCLSKFCLVQIGRSSQSFLRSLRSCAAALASSVDSCSALPLLQMTEFVTALEVAQKTQRCETSHSNLCSTVFPGTVKNFSLFPNGLSQHTVSPKFQAGGRPWFMR